MNRQQKISNSLNACDSESAVSKTVAAEKLSREERKSKTGSSFWECNMKISTFGKLAATAMVTLAAAANFALAQEVGQATEGHVRYGTGQPVRNSFGECINLGYSVGPAHPQDCVVKAAEAKPPAPPVAPPPAPAYEKYTLSADVLFKFDRYQLKDALPEGLKQLDDVATKIQSYAGVESVTVTGYTDRIGTDKYNQRLSERRANSVKDYLVGKGVDANKITATGKGKANPVVTCKGTKVNKALIACLQPNRRVEIEVRGERQK
jgi:OOP family OmpA-OmpF porin